MKYEVCRLREFLVIALQQSVDGQTDRQTDGQTDRQTDRVITIGLPHFRCYLQYTCTLKKNSYTVGGCLFLLRFFVCFIEKYQLTWIWLPVCACGTCKSKVWEYERGRDDGQNNPYAALCCHHKQFGDILHFLKKIFSISWTLEFVDSPLHKNQEN